MRDRTWRGDGPLPAPVAATPLGHLRGALKAAALIVVNFGCLALLLLIRIVEAPLFRPRRPLTPSITRLVCRTSLAIIGIRYRILGHPQKGGGAMVANHSSWLDIYALNAACRLYFVSKAEVAGWPGIGWLARATGTVFIARQRSAARAQVALFRERLAVGHELLFFPEGTSSDGLRVLPFNPTLFDTFMDPALAGSTVQPVSVIYTAPEGADPRFYGWWAAMGFGPHLWKILTAPRQGAITVRFHEPLRVGDFADRKALARAAEEAVRVPDLTRG